MPPLSEFVDRTRRAHVSGQKSLKYAIPRQTSRVAGRPMSSFCRVSDVKKSTRAVKEVVVDMHLLFLPALSLLLVFVAAVLFIFPFLFLSLPFMVLFFLVLIFACY